MRLPFTPEQILGVFAEYNAALWPVAVAFWLASVGVLTATWRKPMVYGRVLTCLLAGLWAWNAVQQGMSHSEALSRLIVGDTRSDVIRWALRRAIDKIERGCHYDASHLRYMIDASPRAALMVLRVTHLLAAGALVCGFGLAGMAIGV